MMMIQSLLFLCLILSIASAFQFPARSLFHSQLRLRTSTGFVVGENVPEEILKLQAVNDLVLVERYSNSKVTSNGFILPIKDGDDSRRLGKVLSVPVGTTSVTHTGRKQTSDELNHVNVGDVVFVEDAWGIGPWHYEINNRFFSFHRAKHLNAVVKKSEAENQ